MEQWEKIQERMRRLDKFIEAVSSEDQSNSAHSIFYSTERWLKQFNLDSELTSSRILMEAFRRAQQSILQGAPIERIPASIKKLSFSIIKEYSTDRKYKNLLAQRLSQPRCSNGKNPDKALEQINIKALLEAFKKLSKDDLDILHWIKVQGLSFQESTEKWKTLKGETITESELLEKYELALSLLRKGLTSINPDFPFQVGG